MNITRQHNGVEETLYHIQNMNIRSDGTAYDMFMWSKLEPTEEELRQWFADDYGCDTDDDMADEFATNSEVYKVYVSEEE